MIDLARLSSQGRAFSPLRPWTNEENEAVALFVAERGLDRTKAADYVRNGAITLEDFDAMIKKGVEPTTLDEAQQEVEKTLKKTVTKKK